MHENLMEGSNSPLSESVKRHKSNQLTGLFELFPFCGKWHKGNKKKQIFKDVSGG